MTRTRRTKSGLSPLAIGASANFVNLEPLDVTCVALIGWSVSARAHVRDDRTSIVGPLWQMTDVSVDSIVCKKISNVLLGLRQLSKRIPSCCRAEHLRREMPSGRYARS